MRALALVGILVAGCSPPIAIPPPPDVEGFPIAVVGWEGTQATAILEVDDSTMSSSIAESVHWLGLPQDPRALFPDQENFIQLSPRGIPLRPHELIYRLQSSLTGAVWSIDPTFEALGWGWPSSKEIGYCALSRSCVSDGVCGGAGCLADDRPPLRRPQSPLPGCPQDWLDIGQEGEPFCFPEEWVVGGEVKVPDVNLGCGAGEMDIGAGCELLTPCSEGFGPVPQDATNVVYVDAEAAPGGTGDRNSPYNTIEPALVDGATIMLAPGSYPGPSVGSFRPAHVIGTCAAEVQLEFSLRFEGAPSVSVQNLRMTADNPFLARDSVVEIRGVQFLDESVVAVRSSTVTMTRSDLRARNLLGNALVVNRSLLAVQDSVVGKTTIRTASVGFDRVRVFNERASNVVNVVDSFVSFSDVEVFGQAAYALAVTSSVPVAGDDYRIVLTNTRIAAAAGLLLEEGPTTAQLTRVGIVGMGVGGLDEDLTGIHQYGPAVYAREIAIVGVRAGLRTSSPRHETFKTHGSFLSLERGWISWSGQFALRTGRRSMIGGELTDVSLYAETESAPFPDRLGTDQRAVMLGAGEWTIDRMRLRPWGRTAIEVQDRVTAALKDIEVLGPHGRSLVFQIGSTTEVSRFEALGGSDGVAITPQVGELGDLLVRDIRLKMQPINERAGFGLNFGAASIALESFAFDGLQFVNQTGDVTLTDGEIGFTDDAAWTDDFRSRLMNVLVYRRATSL